MAVHSLENLKIIEPLKINADKAQVKATAATAAKKIDYDFEYPISYTYKVTKIYSREAFR